MCKRPYEDRAHHGFRAGLAPSLNQMGVSATFVTPDTDRSPRLGKDRSSSTLACGPHRTAALLRALHGWAVFFIF